MTVSYRGFAPVYDILMSDHPYAARAEYLGFFVNGTASRS